MHTSWCDERIAYDGTQLRAHWLLARFGVVGDAAVAFRGPCRVQAAEIADLADLDGPGIAADDMVHVVWETFAATDLLSAARRLKGEISTWDSSGIFFDLKDSIALPTPRIHYLWTHAHR